MTTSHSTIDWLHLLDQAIKARELAYAPYSRYQVGAALLTATGKIYTGCNVESATHTPCICAERTAIFKAVSEGEQDFVAIAVATANGGAPCGVCRQVMREFATDLQILVGDTERNYQIFTLTELLPYSFGPENLAISA